MYAQIVAVALLAAFAAATPTKKPASSITVADCPANLKRDKFLRTFGDKCYWFERNYAMSHSKAVEECTESGGIMVNIKSAEENKFIQETLKNDLELDDAHMWIGLTFNPMKEQFVWSDGAKMSYNNLTDAKNWDYQGYCGAMYTKNGEWMLYSCKDEGVLFTETHGFVCEYAPVK